jgi:hypothetical protein
VFVVQDLRAHFSHSARESCRDSPKNGDLGVEVRGEPSYAPLLIWGLALSDTHNEKGRAYEA